MNVSSHFNLKEITNEKNLALASLLTVVFAIPVTGFADSSQDPCLNERVPTTTIDYFQEHQLSGPPGQPPMDTEQDTLEYRTAAYDFFEQNYGLVFDPNIQGTQVNSDGTAVVQSFKLPDDTRYQVLAFDNQPVN